MFRFISLFLIVGCGGSIVPLPTNVKAEATRVHCMVGSVYDRVGEVVNISRNCQGPSGIKFIARPGEYTCAPIGEGLFRCDYDNANAYSIDPWEGP